MKTKIALLAIAAVVLLSFTFSATSKKASVNSTKQEQTSTDSNSGGLAMEDRDQWK